MKKVIIYFILFLLSLAPFLYLTGDFLFTHETFFLRLLMGLGKLVVIFFEGVLFFVYQFIKIGVIFFLPYILYRYFIDSFRKWYYTPERIKKLENGKLLDELYRINHQTSIVKKRIKELYYPSKYIKTSYS